RLHGRYGLPLARGGAGHGRRPDQAGVSPRDRRSGVRGRGALRHGTGAVLQDLGETDSQDGAPSSSLRAQRLAGASRRGPILDRGGALRPSRLEHDQASMNGTAVPWFQGSRALVVGLARSGIAASKLLLKHGGEVRGNIGTALSELAEEVPEDGLLVVEISSFQLESCTRFHPRVGVLLNVTPDHLDRHGSMERYAGLKSRLFEFQNEGEYRVQPL